MASIINTPTSKTLQLAEDILMNSFDNEKDPYYTEDSLQFSDFIGKCKLPVGYVLVSLDVVSLYSNIPIDLILSVVRHKWPFIN